MTGFKNLGLVMVAVGGIVDVLLAIVVSEDVGDRHLVELLGVRFNREVASEVTVTFWQTWVNFKRTKLRNIKTEKEVRTGHRTLPVLHAHESQQCDIALIQNKRLSQVGRVIDLCNGLGLNMSQTLGKVIDIGRMDVIL